MKNSTSKTAIHWFLPFMLVAGAYACGASSSGTDGATSTKGNGASCTANTECTSGVCMSGVCQGNGQGAPSSSQCSSNAQCASLSCSPTTGTCAAGTGLSDGMSCSSASECKSAACTQGICGTTGIPTGSAGGANSSLGGAGSNPTGLGGSGFAGGTSGPTSPPFKGDPNFTPLATGCGPETSHECIPCSNPSAPSTTATVLRQPTFLCFGADTSQGGVDPTPDDPAAIIEQVVETYNGKTYVHVRVTFDPAFVDNTYGTNSVGWNPKRPHTFVSDLTKSDHLDLLLTDTTGKTAMELGEDYISPAVAGSTTAKCGYENLGVTGGDGYMTTGSASMVLATATSADRNVTGCGYCESPACGDGTTSASCTVNSPKTDANFTTNPQTPNWNFNVVYEVWVDIAAFGTAGFGQAYIDYVHASPSKTGTNTLYVKPQPCPPGIGHCTAGQDCWTHGIPDGGTPPPTDGGTGTCPQNYQVYVTLEGGQTCTPIPFANYPNHAACPTGYILDTASEGRYCLPSP